MPDKGSILNSVGVRGRDGICPDGLYQGEEWFTVGADDGLATACRVLTPGSTQPVPGFQRDGQGPGHAETGELFIRPERAPHPWRFDRNIPCVVTKDSEIYMNDCFSGLGEIEVGDLIESIGYRDHDRFILSLVSVTRNQSEPPLPELSPPTTEPAANTPKE